MFVTRFLTAAACALVFSDPVLAADIEIEAPYARSASVSAKSGAAFMVIRNTGDEDDHLVSARSPAAARVELHTHDEDENGVMRMRHVEEGFTLPAGGEIVMRRGGRHVMFMGLTETFEQGRMIPLTLVFERAGNMEIELPVDLDREPRPGDGHGAGMAD